MKFVTAVLTAPRPTSLLNQTIRSLSRGGFALPWVFDGSPTHDSSSSVRGCTDAYRRLFRAALRNWPDRREALLVFEDDVLVCLHLAEYLAELAWPSDLERIACVSPYCPTAYSDYGPQKPWHREDHRPFIAGTQAFLYPVHVLHELANYLDPERLNADGTPSGVDVQIGHFAQSHGLEIWYHIPSFVQHVGIRNSAVGYLDDLGSIYSSETFVGEDFDARTLPCNTPNS